MALVKYFLLFRGIVNFSVKNYLCTCKLARFNQLFPFFTIPNNMYSCSFDIGHF